MDLLKSLISILPKDAYCLLGVLFTDLYPRDSWNYVFGQASLAERTGVFSFARYDERFFDQKGDYQINDTTETVFFRSCQVSSHEIGHMFGLHHCIFYNCKMNGSNHLEESIARSTLICPVCLRKLQYNLQFNILERYKALYQFASQEKVEEWQIIAKEYYNLIQIMEQTQAKSKYQEQPLQYQQQQQQENEIQEPEQQQGNSKMEKAQYNVLSLKCQYDSLN